MPLRVATSPSSLAVSLADAKAWLRIEHDERDAEILALVDTAQAMAEEHTQRRFVTQTIEWVTSDLCARFPVAPVDPASVAVAYVPDGASGAVTWDATNYRVRQHGAMTWIEPRSGVALPVVDRDAAEPIVITFTAGVSAGDVPAKIRQAILFKVMQLEAAGRGANADQTTFEALLRAETW